MGVATGIVVRVMKREGDHLVDGKQRRWAIYAEREVTKISQRGNPYFIRVGSIYGPEGYVWNFRELMGGRYRCSINLRVPKWR